MKARKVQNFEVFYFIFEILISTPSQRITSLEIALKLERNFYKMELSLENEAKTMENL